MSCDGRQRETPRHASANPKEPHGRRQEGILNIRRFEMNVPTEVALQSPQGVLVPGRYGDRMMFQLADGKVMYVPPIVATQIEAQGITVGETFQLWKATTKVGQRRSIEWKVR